MSKEERIKIIQEFVGEGGYIAFEHGFRPNFNAYGIAYDHIDRRIPLDGERIHYFKDMTNEQLDVIALDLIRYMNYCRNHA